MASSSNKQAEIEKIIRGALSRSGAFRNFATELQGVEAAQAQLEEIEGLKQTLQTGMNQSGKSFALPKEAEPSKHLSQVEISQQNFVITTMEKDLMKMINKSGYTDTPEIRAQIAKIRNWVRLYPGTTSTYVDELESVINGYVPSVEVENLIKAAKGGARKSRMTLKKRKGKGKGKGKGKNKSAKKSRRHHSKSK